jgi:hypothetical protein
LNEARVRTKSETIIKRDEYVVPDSVKNIGKDKFYCIYTYGCQMNVHDSENISAIMEDMGYSKCLDMDSADVIILNTAHADYTTEKAVEMLSYIKNDTNIFDNTGTWRVYEKKINKNAKVKYQHALHSWSLDAVRDCILANKTI